MAKKPRMHWVYYFGRFLIRLLVLPFAWWKTRGKENVPKDGPVLVVSNHLHLADSPVVAASLPRQCYFMAKSDLWDNKWSRFWVENFGAFPVKRDSFDRETIRLAEAKLKQGFGVIMFPEGGRSPDGQMRQGLPGAAMIAARLNVPILPVGITGSEFIKRLGWAVLHHPTMTVNIGRPFYLPPPSGDKNGREQRREDIDYIMRKIAELLPPSYRGVYGDQAETKN